MPEIVSNAALSSSLKLFKTQTTVVNFRNLACMFAERHGLSFCLRSISIRPDTTIGQITQELAIAGAGLTAYMRPLEQLVDFSRENKQVQLDCMLKLEDLTVLVKHNVRIDRELQQYVRFVKFLSDVSILAALEVLLTFKDESIASISSIPERRVDLYLYLRDFAGRRMEKYDDLLQRVLNDDELNYEGKHRIEELLVKPPV